jgi:hypothetical protein
MKILKSYSAGLKRTVGLTKIVTIIYSITLLLGLILAFSFNSQMTKLLSSRMELYKLLQDFDYTLYTDFTNNYSFIIQPFMQIIIWFSCFYLFFTIFFAGGIFKSFEGSVIKSKPQAFFAGCVKYFFRFLRLGIYTFIFQFIIHSIIAAVFGMILQGLIETSAEPAIFILIVIWAVLHLLFFVLISLISDYAKIILVKEDSKKVWKALYGSLKFSLRKIHLTFPIYLSLIIIPVILTIIYWVLDGVIGTTSGLTVLIMFLIQQIYIWLRLFSKVWLLAGEYEYFNMELITKWQPMITQEIITDETL